MTDVNFDEIFKYILLFRKDCEVVGLNERLRWILWNGKLSWVLDFRFLKYSDGQYFKPHYDGTYTRPDGTETSYITIQVVDWSQWCWCYSLPLKNVIKTNLSSYWWGEGSCWSCGSCGSGGFSCLWGSGWANSGYFLATQSDPAEFDDRQVCESLEVISNECVDFDYPKELNDPQVSDDPKRIWIENMDFDPKVYGDTSSIDGLVFFFHKYTLMAMHQKAFLFSKFPQKRAYARNPPILSIVLNKQDHHHCSCFVGGWGKWKQLKYLPFQCCC